jgi:hypothetical protein
VAWNIDGSAGDRLYRKSWIQYWKETTGDEATCCSYSDCNRPAAHGGHVWVARNGVFIVPLCTKCNYCENPNRMQGSQSKLRYGTKLVEGEYTEEMKNTLRRIAVEVCCRHCETCGGDISASPDDHVLCLPCFRSGSGRPHRTEQKSASRPAGNSLYASMEERSCETCGRNIMDRPVSHTLFLDCFCGQRSAEYDDRERSRKRSSASFDINQDTGTKSGSTMGSVGPLNKRPAVSANPRSGPRNRNLGRSCQGCGDSLNGRPSNHTMCLDCFRR